MLKLLRLLEYAVHEGFLRHYQRTLALHYFLEKYKGMDVRQRKCFKGLFRGLYQKGFLVSASKLDKKVREVELCSEFIPVDGKADELQIQAVKSRLPSFCKDMTCQDLVYISSLLDHSKQVSEIVLPYSLEVPELPAAEVNWKYELKEFTQTIEVDA